MRKKKNKYGKEYALYDGDEFVAMGTMKEIAITTNMTWSNVRHIKTNTKNNLKRNKGYLLIEVKE